MNQTTQKSVLPANNVEITDFTDGNDWAQACRNEWKVIGTGYAGNGYKLRNCHSSAEIKSISCWKTRQISEKKVDVEPPMPKESSEDVSEPQLELKSSSVKSTTSSWGSSTPTTTSSWGSNTQSTTRAWGGSPKTTEQTAENKRHPWGPCDDSNCTKLPTCGGKKAEKSTSSWEAWGGRGNMLEAITETPKESPKTTTAPSWGNTEAPKVSGWGNTSPKKPFKSSPNFQSVNDKPRDVDKLAEMRELIEMRKLEAELAEYEAKLAAARATEEIESMRPAGYERMLKEGLRRNEFTFKEGDRQISFSNGDYSNVYSTQSSRLPYNRRALKEQSDKAIQDMFDMPLV